MHQGVWHLRGRAFSDEQNMSTHKISGPILAALSTIVAGTGLATEADSPSALQYHKHSLMAEGRQHRVRVPKGYRLELLTTALDGPRMAHFDAQGVLWLGSHSGKIYRLYPPYRDAEVIANLPGYPHSLAIRGKEILIARTEGVWRGRRPARGERLRPGDLQLLAPLPGGRGHNSRTLGIGPDNRIYLSLGLSGNCSNQYLHPSYPAAARRGGILVLNEDLGPPQWQPYGSGLRNPVGFDWQPHTGALYASNNGPDHLGFDQPPEYFSRIDPGSFHGMPWFQFDGKKIRRDDCIAKSPPRPASDVTPPAVTFPARNAPLGMAFVPAAPQQPWSGDAVVALHGSWGTRPSGSYLGSRSTRRPPKLVLVRFAGGKAQRVEDLVTGFQLRNGSRWARPAGVAAGPDGAVYFTSDADTHALFRLYRVAQ